MKLSRRDIRVWPRLLNLIYPRRCPICDDVTGGYDILICESCRALVRHVTEPVCRKCGKQLEKDTDEYCADCSKHPHRYECGRAALAYDARMRASVSRFKYHNRREYADFYARELYEACADAVRRWEVDMIVPIPLHKSRMRRRGFNQAELVAKRFGALTNIQVRPDLLIREKKTRPQKELNSAERRSNLKSAFQVGENELQLKRILLIDDIYTTGSTIDAAAAALIAAGAGKVYFLAICIGTGF